jgi:hypothetical protein
VGFQIASLLGSQQGSIAISGESVGVEMAWRRMAEVRREQRMEGGMRSGGGLRERRSEMDDICGSRFGFAKCGGNG